MFILQWKYIWLSGFGGPPLLYSCQNDHICRSQIYRQNRPRQRWSLCKLLVHVNVTFCISCTSPDLDYWYLFLIMKVVLITWTRKLGGRHSISFIMIFFVHRLHSVFRCNRCNEHAWIFIFEFVGKILVYDCYFRGHYIFRQKFCSLQYAREDIVWLIGVCWPQVGDS